MKSKATKSTAAGVDAPQTDFATQTEESEGVVDRVEHGSAAVEVNHGEIQTAQRK